MKKYIITGLMMLLLLGGNSELFAQYGQRQQGRDGTNRQGTRVGQDMVNRPRMQQRQAMQDLKRLERLRMMKLMDLLELDAETEAIVVPQIQRYHKQMFLLMREHQKKIDQLANGLKKNKYTDQEIIDRIKEIDHIERERQDKIAEFHIKAKKILTAEQLGKLYVFQARFGSEVLEKIRNFKKAQEERRLHDGRN